MPRWSFSIFTKSFRDHGVVGGYEAVPLVADGGSDEEGALWISDGKASLPAIPERGLTSGTEVIHSPPARPGISSRISTCLWSILVQVWFALRPKILSPPGNKQQQQSATAWLNGVRGVAAVFVVFAHLRPWLYPQYGDGWSSQHPRFLELPIIRIFYSGTSMVTIFFIISGYALSFKPLGLMSQNQLVPTYNSLASSLFRRGIRLFIPMVTIAFISVWVGYFDLWYQSEQKSGEDNGPLDTLSRWFDAVLCGINPFSDELSNIFQMPLVQTEAVLWTIPIEYRGSLAVFGLLLVLSRTTPPICMGSLAVILLWLTYVGQWDIFLFTAGMACCQLSYMTRKVESPTLGDIAADDDKRKNRCRNVLLGVVAPVLALFPILYVLSQPGAWLHPPDWPGRGDAPIYPTLNRWTPSSWEGHNDPGRFWTCISAIAFILLVDYTEIYRRFFESSFPQYLGKISFSMYLVHPLIIKVVLMRWNDLVSPLTADIGIWWIKESVSVAINALVFFPLLFWVSALSTRFLDQGSVELARWLESKFYTDQKSIITTTNVGTQA